MPPLVRAALDGRIVPVRQMLTAPRIDLDAPTPRSGKTALVHASRAGHLVVVQMLLGAGADVSVADVRGWTAIHFAAWKGHLSECLSQADLCILLTYTVNIALSTVAFFVEEGLDG